MTAVSQQGGRGRFGALAVGLGIFLSRIAGFVRERALAHVLGTSEAGGAFRAALRIPNLLQNLLGEGVLSASFIPAYARLLGAGDEASAALVARTVGTLLTGMAALLALVGMAFAEPLVGLLAPGFDGPTRALTAQLVQVLFPGTALLVLSAFCLGVLNAHRQFLLAYAAPVAWNGAIVVAALLGGWQLGLEDAARLAEWVAWGTVAGSLLQLLVQLPAVMRLVRPLTPALRLELPGVQQTLRTFGPVVLGRGSVQLSSYVDQLLSSYLGATLVSGIAYAQTLALLPVSLFGMAVSAAELPEMSRAQGEGDERAQAVRARLEPALRRVAFFVVPSAAAFLVLGEFAASALFRTGRFGDEDARMVGLLLAGSALGLTASTQGRLLSSAFNALGDTRTPLRFSLVRLFLTSATALLAVFPARQLSGWSPVWGGFGLTAGAGLAAWVEFALLRRALSARLGGLVVPDGLVARLLALSIPAALLARGLSLLLPELHPVLRAAAVFAPFGLLHLAGCAALKVPELELLAGPVRRRLGRRR